ncbi:hypothetical protein FisN_15Lh029 [Fistulifera solaris]|uniref:Palmitoyltransferase n=1 Tax=Fistulifera solaris TaxID=1519565 RepID=A0A1Z5KHC0_FISSO|nr:hypothetical protein FisN_15Lh029 [Fistulifera solaris]|eukprot:GAX25659.1 hypothetical protein FisN_15Lh029 [Fistulifera solaris]
MMHDSDEVTPLVRRTRVLTQRRNHDDEDEDEDDFDLILDHADDEEKKRSFHPMNQRDKSLDDSSFGLPKIDLSKQDRRNPLVRAFAAVHRLLQASSLKAVPPLEDARHYEDTGNDEPWSCSIGTREENGVWINYKDRAGSIMSAMVWILIYYSIYTVLLLAVHGHVPLTLTCLYCTLAVLMLSSHAKTALTDPGAVPSSALPLPEHQHNTFHSMCSQCQTYKPEKSHHCRICNRCISGMDHHCPWMNNCIGAANMKHFILFLIYTWTASALVLLLFIVNYFFCTSALCEFTGVEIVLVRVMSLISLGALMFTSSMLMNVIFNVVTGTSTIDRLKMKLADTWHKETAAEIPLTDIFGIGPKWTWMIPTDPLFDDYDRVVGYSTRQRLLRKLRAP